MSGPAVRDGDPQPVEEFTDVLSAGTVASTGRIIRAAPIRERAARAPMLNA